MAAALTVALPLALRAVAELESITSRPGTSSRPFPAMLRAVPAVGLTTEAAAGAGGVVVGGGGGGDGQRLVRAGPEDGAGERDVGQRAGDGAAGHAGHRGVQLRAAQRGAVGDGGGVGPCDRLVGPGYGQ